MQKKQERETAVSQKSAKFALQYVQTTDFGAKVHNFRVTAKRREEKCHRQGNWSESFHDNARTQAEQWKPWQVCVGNRTEERRVSQAQAAWKPRRG